MHKKRKEISAAFTLSKLAPRKRVNLVEPKWWGQEKKMYSGQDPLTIRPADLKPLRVTLGNDCLRAHSSKNQHSTSVPALLT